MGTAGSSITDAGASPPHPRASMPNFRWHPASGSPPEDTGPLSWTVLLLVLSEASPSEWARPAPVTRGHLPPRGNPGAYERRGSHESLHVRQHQARAGRPCHSYGLLARPSEAPTSLWSGVFRRGAAARDGGGICRMEAGGAGAEPLRLQFENENRDQREQHTQARTGNAPLRPEPSTRRKRRIGETRSIPRANPATDLHHATRSLERTNERTNERRRPSPHGDPHPSRL